MNQHERANQDHYSDNHGDRNRDYLRLIWRLGGGRRGYCGGGGRRGYDGGSGCRDNLGEFEVQGDRLSSNNGHGLRLRLISGGTGLYGVTSGN